VTKYFPLNCRRVGFSHSAPSIKTLAQYVHELKDETPTVFTVGGFWHCPAAPPAACPGVLPALHCAAASVTWAAHAARHGE
jgi:hypothetical protein